jgi:hypothetical protein
MNLIDATKLFWKGPRMGRRVYYKLIVCKEDFHRSGF